MVLEFQAGYDIDKALDDVREKVDLAKPDLPEDTDEPFVQEVAFSRFPVLVVTLSGDVPERSLRTLADRLQDKIEGIPAVLEATMSGEREELVELVIDPLRVEAYGLALDEIGTIVARSNRLVAAGTMDTGQGRFAIKVPGLFESAADILDMPLKVSGDAVVQVKDIATLRRTFKDPESVARIDGLPAIGIEVSKRAGENIIETINQVRALVAAESQAWPPQVKVTYSQDSSKEIRSMLGELENSLITAVLLVLIVIVASLGLRGGLIVGIAVPGSFLIGILMLAGFGISHQHRGAVQPHHGDRHAGRRRHHPGRVRRSLHAERHGPPHRLCRGDQAHGLADLLLHHHHHRRLRADGVLARHHRRVHEVPADHAVGDAVRLAADGDDLHSLHRRPDRQAERRRRCTCRGRAALGRGAARPGARPGLGLSRSPCAARCAIPSWSFSAASAFWSAPSMAFMTFNAGVEFFPDVEPEVAQVQIHARGNMSVNERDDLVKARRARDPGHQQPSIASCAASTA